MGMNSTPSGERTQIGFFGRRNAGKSSIVNAMTGQELAVVSEIKGTTTDPVYKTMELLPLGPVMIIDTPGFDDEGYLGELRVRKTKQVLNKTDIAVLVADASEGLKECDKELIALFQAKEIRYIIVYNKSDLLENIPTAGPQEIYVSALKKEGIFELKERVASLKGMNQEKHIVADLINPGDFIVLVVPIDSAAPKGRLILPQQQVLRDILDAGAMAVVTRESELEQTLQGLAKNPALVITDSQVFQTVAAIVPKDIKLTSFSVLMAKYKGLLDAAAPGAAAIEQLRDGDTVLIAEGCTHHRQCDDIGTVKIPRWLRKYTGKDIRIETCSGTEFPEDLSPYAMVIHCGGCMLNEREMQSRISRAKSAGIPITNYGIAIAHMHGILKRSIEPFPEIARLLDK